MLLKNKVHSSILLCNKNERKKYSVSYMRKENIQLGKQARETEFLFRLIECPEYFIGFIFESCDNIIVLVDTNNK